MGNQQIKNMKAAGQRGPVMDGTNGRGMLPSIVCPLEILNFGHLSPAVSSGFAHVRDVQVAPERADGPFEGVSSRCCVFQTIAGLREVRGKHAWTYHTFTFNSAAVVLPVGIANRLLFRCSVGNSTRTCTLLLPRWFKHPPYHVSALCLAVPLSSIPGSGATGLRHKQEGVRVLPSVRTFLNY